MRDHKGFFMGFICLPADEQGLLEQQVALPFLHRAAFLVGQRLLKRGGKRAQLFIPRLDGRRYIRSLRGRSHKKNKPGCQGQHAIYAHNTSTA